MRIAAGFVIAAALCAAHLSHAVCPDPDEPNDSPAQAVPLAPESEEIRCMDSPGDVDYFTYDVDAGAGFCVRVTTYGVNEGGVSVTPIDDDGITVLPIPVAYYDTCMPSPCLSFSAYTDRARTYYFTVQTLDGWTGDYLVAFQTRPVTLSPVGVQNMLRMTREGGDAILQWNYSAPTSGARVATEFAVYRGTLATTEFYDLLGTTEDFSYSAGPVADAAPVEYYSVCSENSFGVGDTLPSFLRIDTVPAQAFTLANGPFSIDPCADPNDHPTLPMPIQARVSNRVGDPVDGIAVWFRLNPYFDFAMGHTFCPDKVSNTWRTTGQDGPGTAEVIFSIGGDFDPTTCSNFSDGHPYRCTGRFIIQPDYFGNYDMAEVWYWFE